jgi:hypothetical protein
VSKVSEQFRNSKQQVTYLRRLIEKKVDALLMIELATQKQLPDML